ncbi:homoserine O-acetyltransferase [bacterium]|nr:homoserine O-acetyltransferase [bacterium]
MTRLQETKTQFCEIATSEDPFVLQDGSTLGPCVVAYETYGELNEDRSNAILIFHALTGSHHAAGFDPIGPGNEFWKDEVQQGWWEGFIGPGLAVDTNRYYVICANYLGGCYGTTGPATVDPVTGDPYGSRFPWPSVSDIVDSQVRLLDKLGIQTLLGAIGGSMGGFCTMDLAVRYPDRVKVVIPIASGLRATVLSKVHNFEQIYAIQEDPDFQNGDYYDGPRPERGLILARMIAHKTYVSLSVMEERARGEVVQPTDLLSGYNLQHRIESYMLHQGRKFVQRFDPNSYLRIVNAWQAFDLPKQQADGDSTQALSTCQGQNWLVFTIDSDVSFYYDEQAEIAQALRANGIPFQYITVHSEKGHDSFLLEPDLFTPHIHFMLAKNS